MDYIPKHVDRGCALQEQFLNGKVLIFKKKRRKNSRTLNGHRQVSYLQLVNKVYHSAAEAVPLILSSIFLNAGTYRPADHGHSRLETSSRDQIMTLQISLIVYALLSRGAHGAGRQSTASPSRQLDCVISLQTCSSSYLHEERQQTLLRAMYMPPCIHELHPCTADMHSLSV